jgi:hypothetical protein
MKALTISTLIALSCAILASTASSQELPPVPEGGLLHYKVFDCVDKVSKLAVVCVQSRDMEGNEYMTLMQGSVVVEIRLLVGDGYTVIYQTEHFGTF